VLKAGSDGVSFGYLLFLRAVGPGTLSFNLFLRKGPSGVKLENSCQLVSIFGQTNNECYYLVKEV